MVVKKISRGKVGKEIPKKFYQFGISSVRILPHGRYFCGVRNVSESLDCRKEEAEGIQIGASEKTTCVCLTNWRGTGVDLQILEKLFGLWRMECKERVFLYLVF